MRQQIKCGFIVRTTGILLAITISLIISSCEDFLEDVDPSAALPVDDGFSNLNDLELFLGGTYRALIGFGGDLFWVVLPDLMTIDVTTISSPCPNPRQYDFNELTADNGFLQAAWSRAYETINQTNVLLEKVDQLSSDGIITTEDARRLAGEAHFLRAFANFQLVRLFAKPIDQGNGGELAVPLPLSGVTAASELENLPRATVSELYAQIIIDFERASSLLQGSSLISGRANEWAAIAFLAEVAFQQGDYAGAFNHTRTLIDADVFGLVSSPEEYFNQAGTREEVWSITHTNQEPNGLLGLTLGTSCNSVMLPGDLYARAFDLIVTTGQKEVLSGNGWSVVDLRYTHLTNAQPENWRSLKYSSPDESDNVPAMRYAEIVLMHAECLARINDISGSVQYLNMIRARALEVYDENESLLSDDVILFAPEDFESGEELIEAIILERQVELLLEGNRFHDLMRLQRDVNGIPYDDCRLRWPIPQGELDANPNISQDYPGDC
ncbi:MAG: RagB/SusD family nutrient uptake outer membrane protein [Saprospiraceae bacterium]|nr:RagB/SusD family nutrient uptake outer membrane protein [Saprospiraceae bacterium]